MTNITRADEIRKEISSLKAQYRDKLQPLVEELKHADPGATEIEKLSEIDYDEDLIKAHVDFMM